MPHVDASGYCSVLHGLIGRKLVGIARNLLDDDKLVDQNGMDHSLLTWDFVEMGPGDTL